MTNANLYDRFPYGQRSHPQTHPDRLCTVARLFGMTPADPARCRVLELGCASGGNLIPMAFNLPDARFLGVDSSAEQVRDGQRRAEDLGLENLELRVQSIEELEVSGRFDYIICHGVYSWVSDEVRASIFEVCRRHLAEQGVAQVSFNTLPGWNLVKSVRDLMRFHADIFVDPKDKTEQARALLELVTAAGGEDEDPYSLLFKREIEVLSEVDDSYLLHDHLADLNRPDYFHDFERTVRQHGLSFLADSDLSTMLPENLAPDVADKLREVADFARMQQYIDFLVGRRFRNALLCHEGVSVNRELDLESLRGFYLATPCAADLALEEHHLQEGVEVSFSSGSTTISVRGSVGKTGLAILSEEHGRAIEYSEFLERLATRTGMAPAAVEGALEDELSPVRLVFANAITLQSLAPAFVNDVEEKPATTRLVRAQAAEGTSVTNQRHESIHLGPAEQLLVARMDGSRTEEDLVEVLSEALASGALQLSVDGGPPAGGIEASEALEQYCRHALVRLARNALLVRRTDRLRVGEVS